MSTPEEGRPASPIIRRQRLARELRVIRENRGLTAEEVAANLSWSPSKLSRYELARTALKPAHVAAMLDAYEITGAERDRLMAFAREGAARAWWDQDDNLRLPAAYRTLIGLENESAEILAWAAAAVPVLLQAPGYARAAVTSWAAVDPTPPAMIERIITARLARQQILDLDDPPRLAVVLDEAVLRRRTGSPAVMAAQMAHLAEAGRRPAVSIRVLPLAAQHPAAADSFTLLRVEPGEPGAREVAAVELPGQDAHMAEGERETFLLGLAFTRLQAAALDEEASAAAIAAAWR